VRENHILSCVFCLTALTTQRAGCTCANVCSGVVAVADSVVQGVPSSPILIFRHKGLSNSVNFTRSRFVDSCGTSVSCAPIALDMNPGINHSIGNVSFVSAHLRSRLSSTSPCLVTTYYQFDTCIHTC
jgi:hypothetical protein